MSGPVPGHDLSAADAVRSVAEVLARASVPSPSADARWLVGEALGADPHRHADEVLPAASRVRLDEMVARRTARVPLQLILGHTSFRTLEIVCRSGVFLPRPETEVVAGVAIDAARSAVAHSCDGRPAVARRRAVVVEPCTGSGAIACSIAAEVPGVRVIASDHDGAAVALAAHNAARLEAGEAGPAGMADGSVVEVVVGDLLDGIDPALRGAVDVLVANPPYLPIADRDSWLPEVAEHEPLGALVGGADGHEVLDALLHLAVEWLAPGGTVVLEIDERRGADALAAAGDAGLAAARLVTDLSDADRAVVAMRRPAA